jgi:hypothetical protein
MAAWQGFYSPNPHGELGLSHEFWACTRVEGFGVWVDVFCAQLCPERLHYPHLECYTACSMQCFITTATVSVCSACQGAFSAAGSVCYKAQLSHGTLAAGYVLVTVHVAE